jgi:hypothetical protein
MVAKIHTIEFQKHGLPHIYCLFIIGDQDKPRSTMDYDGVISAEIPNSITHQRLHKTMIKSIMHGPCGLDKPNATCMENRKCAKKFPKAFASSTIKNEDGYPLYQRYDAYIYVYIYNFILKIIFILN